MAAQAQVGEVGLERRVVGLPTAIGTTFSLIVASSVLATVAGGFFASWVWLVALAIGLVTMIFAAHELLRARDDDPEGGLDERVRPRGPRAVLRHRDRRGGLHRRAAVPGHRRGLRGGDRHVRRSRRARELQGLGRDLRRLHRRDQPARDPAVRGSRGRADVRGRGFAARHRAWSGSWGPASATRSRARFRRSTSPGAFSRRSSASRSSRSWASSTRARSRRS